MLRSLALRCNQYCSLVLMHLLLRTSQDCTPRALHRYTAVGLGFYAAVGLPRKGITQVVLQDWVFCCSRTALQDHFTGSAVGLGFYAATGLPCKGITQVALQDWVFLLQQDCTARPRNRQCCGTWFLLQQNCTSKALRRQCCKTGVFFSLQQHCTGRPRYRQCCGTGFLLQLDCTDN